VATPELTVEVRDGLGEHRARWDELAAAQPLPSPFLRSWWLDHTAAGEPRVVLCFDGDDLVGGAAFEVDRFGVGPLSLERVRCIGQGPLAPDHLDLVATPEHHLAVARAVLAWLRRPGQRVIDLDGLAAEGTLARLLAPHEIERVAAPFAELGSDADEYMASRPGALRSTITRAAKRFERAGVTFDIVGADVAEAALERLAELHDGRWGDDSMFLDRWDQLRRAAADGMATGDVQLAELRDQEGEVIASELDLRVGSSLAFYQAGRRTDREWRGCGSVLRARIIGAAVADGVSAYDLLRGDERYKADWATRRRELVRVRVGIGAVAIAALRAARARAAIEARRRAGAEDEVGTVDHTDVGGATQVSPGA
jgi:CelD/BcsL family acetyltransferase involved in cellulose biosynthesis